MTQEYHEIIDDMMTTSADLYLRGMTESEVIDHLRFEFPRVPFGLIESIVKDTYEQEG